MPKRLLTTLIAASMSAGCASLTKPSVPPLPSLAPQVPASLLIHCEAATPLSSGSHQALEAWALDNGRKFQDCRARQQALIEVVRLRAKLQAP